MKVVKVNKSDRAILRDILTHHLDPADQREEPPPLAHLEKLLDDDRSYLLAALLDDVVVGYALAYRFPSLYAPEYLAYLYDMEVLPDHRRKGVGRLLIDTLKIHLTADGVKELWLGTAVDNVEGQGLFSATGAVRSEETFCDYTYYWG